MEVALIPALPVMIAVKGVATEPEAEAEPVEVEMEVEVWLLPIKVVVLFVPRILHTVPAVEEDLFPFLLDFFGFLTMVRFFIDSYI